MRLALILAAMLIASPAVAAGPGWYLVMITPKGHATVSENATTEEACRHQLAITRSIVGEMMGECVQLTPH